VHAGVTKIERLIANPCAQSITVSIGRGRIWRLANSGDSRGLITAHASFRAEESGFVSPFPTTRMRRCGALQGELAPASPRNTSTARLRRTMSSSLRRPIFVPILVLATVVILSIMRLQGFVRPFLSLGVMGNRNNGADVGFVVNGQKVIDNVPTNLSSCKITTGRGFPA
jgi:hypothetical protein